MDLGRPAVAVPLRPQLLDLCPRGPGAPRRAPRLVAHRPAPRPLPPLGWQGLGPGPDRKGALMFDGLFELIAPVLSFFYALVPNYAITTAMLTLTALDWTRAESGKRVSVRVDLG